MNTPILSALVTSLVLALVPSQAQAGGGVSISYRSGGPRSGWTVQASLGAPSRSYAGPRGYRSSCAKPLARRIWVPGHYETVAERHWVPGATRRIWVPASHGVVYDACGRARTVLVSAGHWETVTDPGRFEIRHVRVWRPGAWATR
ncbi:MAG: hypothetical protein QF903_12315 [Planctomycetota bacterium]|jgi:hypothetical protein|nr:hypothetical protein [Planctomycetota bacterium]MDP6761520.1 hypothetical protein [Planctomycetota bacterium]MDP6990244.1 hypothetical protein [Planctomycetota bacterium]